VNRTVSFENEIMPLNGRIFDEDMDKSLVPCFLHSRCVGIVVCSKPADFQSKPAVLAQTNSNSSADVLNDVFL